MPTVSPSPGARFRVFTSALMDLPFPRARFRLCVCVCVTPALARVIGASFRGVDSGLPSLRACRHHHHHHHYHHLLGGERQAEGGVVAYMPTVSPSSGVRFRACTSARRSPFVGGPREPHSVGFFCAQCLRPLPALASSAALVNPTVWVFLVCAQCLRPLAALASSVALVTPTL